YLGVAILMTIMQMVIVINVSPENDENHPTTWRETLRMLFSVPSLIDSLSFILVLWLAVLIGSKRVPYGEMLGINPAEFAGVVKTTSMILVTLFVFATAEGITRVYLDIKKGKTGSPDGAERGEIDGAAANMA